MSGFSTELTFSLISRLYKLKNLIVLYLTSGIELEDGNFKIIINDISYSLPFTYSEKQISFVTQTLLSKHILTFFFVQSDAKVDEVFNQGILYLLIHLVSPKAFKKNDKSSD